MTTLVIGSGLIGSQIARILVEQGEKPVLMDTAAQPQAIGQIVDLAKVTLVAGDVLRPLSIIDVLRTHGITRIAHTAANPLLTLGAQPVKADTQNKREYVGTGVASLATFARLGITDLFRTVSAVLPTLPSSTGTGSLEESRGTYHVTAGDIPLGGERDIFGRPWNTAALAAATTAQSGRRGGTWSGSQWTADLWSNGTWPSVQWSGTDWTGAPWQPVNDDVTSTSEWSGARWSGARWSGARWSGARWSGARWSDSSWT